MKRLTGLAIGLGVLALAFGVTSSAHAGERHWQTGTWKDVGVARQMVDFGPGASGFGGVGGTTGPGVGMRAMADVRTYVIETDDFRLELKDVVPIGRRSIDLTIGGPVTFAIEKKTVYVRDPNGMEHKLRLTKKVMTHEGGF